MQRLQRWGFIFFAMYLVLLGGSPYYLTIFPVRVLHHVLMTVVLAAWLIQRLLRGKGLPSTPLNPLILLLVMLWGFKTVVSLDPRVSAEAVWFPFTHMLMFFAMAAVIQAGRIRLLIETQFLIAALVVITALMQLGSWWFGWGLVPDTSVGWGSLAVQGILPTEFPGLYLPLGVTTWLAGYAAPLSVFSVGWAFTHRQRSVRVSFLLLAAILALIVWFTGARGGLVSMAVGGSVLFMLLFLRSERYRTLSRPQKLGLVALPAAGLVVAGAVVILISQLPRSGSSDQLRLGLWRGAVTIFSENPIHGAGVNMFARAYREARTDAYVDDRLGTAHNAILNTLAETGVLGGALLIALAGTVTVFWWRSWRSSEGPQAVRLAAAFSALAGLAVHSQFDLFTSTPNVLLMLFLVALIVVPPASQQATLRVHRLAAAAACAIVVLYGAAFLVWDCAHAAFNRSLSTDQPLDTALEHAREAQARDPALNLYRLQVAYIVARRADENPALISDAAAELEDALRLEPTWDTGMILLAGLYERQGRVEDALELLTTAQTINGRNLALFTWARLAERYDAADPQHVAEAYAEAMTTSVRGLPLSGWWTETPSRLQALELYAQVAPVQFAYRMWREHDPSRLAALLETLPDDSGGIWVRAEAALDAGQPQTAIEYFTDLRQRGYVPIGDVFGGLGRAWFASDPTAEQTRLYLDAAVAAGTSLESPNVYRAELETMPQQAFALRAQSLPSRVVEQNFEGVLFLGRVASFVLPESMQPPGPGREAMQPWYTIAADFEAAGNIPAAINAYRAIIDYAPDETDARSALRRLEGESS